MVCPMSVPHTLLGLLEPVPQHGYTLKREYDARFGGTRELKFGQVYATLSRLERDGLARVLAVESGDGPDRRRYAITASGVTELEHWLTTPQEVGEHTPGELFVKVTLSLMSGRSAAAVLDGQRAVHLTRLRELADIRRSGEITQRLAADYETAHLKADLTWIETAGARLERWSADLNQGESANGSQP